MVRSLIAYFYKNCIIMTSNCISCQTSGKRLENLFNYYSNRMRAAFDVIIYVQEAETLVVHTNKNSKIQNRVFDSIEALVRSNGN